MKRIFVINECFLVIATDIVTAIAIYEQHRKKGSAWSVVELSEYSLLENNEQLELDVWESDVMSIYNSHNPNLVERINKVFKDPSKLEDLATILYAFAQRDQEEIEDKLDIVVTSRQMAFDYAYEILMHVCDDTDLFTILNFVGYKAD